MRRLLYCAVAAELVLGSLAVAAMSEGARVEPGSARRTAAALETSSVRPEAVMDGRPQAGSPSEPKRARGLGAVLEQAAEAAGGHLVPAASEPDELAGDRRSSGGKEIAFQAPIDVATGAGPTTTAFNLAFGGQGPGLAFPLARATPLVASVAVGDFNGDDKADLAQTNLVAGTVSVFLGDGRGGFSPPRQDPVGVHPVFVVAGHLDRDGNVDLAVANAGSNNVSILRGDGKGGFQPDLVIPVPGPRSVAIGNFDDDRTPDLAVASSGRSMGAITNGSPVGGVAILTGTPGGVFRPAQFITPSLRGRPVGVNYVAVGRFDAGGFDDLAVGVGASLSAGDKQDNDSQLTGDDVLVFLNRGRGGAPEPFTATEQQRFRVGATPNAISVAELNGDTHLDLAVLGLSGDITTLLGDGEGSFALKATNTTVGSLPFSLASGDFDDDRVVDLVTANWTSSTVSVLQGKGDGTFQPAVEFWSGDATTSSAVGDLNGDGRVDVVAGRFRDDHLAVLLNDSPKPGDGVVVRRDIPYGSPTHPINDPFAAHHTLDVYTPPEGTVSFAGNGRPYPVVFFAHGGSGVGGDKTMVGYLMRSLALEGIVGVSTDYRLAGPPSPEADQLQDIVRAFRWTRDNIGSTEYGGDPGNIFVSGTSFGAQRMIALATEARFADEQRDIRGLVTIAGHLTATPGDAPKLPPSLLVVSNGAGDQECLPHTVAFVTVSRAHGGESDYVIVPGRDHLTVTARSALPGDPARVAILEFVRSHLVDS